MTTDKQSLIDLHRKLYEDLIMRRLKNFNRLLDKKMLKMRLESVLGLKPRVLFFLPDSNDFEDYVQVKQESYKKWKQLKNAKLVIKMIASVILSVSSLIVLNRIKNILSILIKKYELAKSKKKKAKQRKKKYRNKNSALPIR